MAKANIGGWLASLSPEERIAHSHQAAAKSAEARVRRRTLRETLDLALRAEIGDAEMRARLKAAGLGRTYGDALVLAMVQRALGGDVEAAKYVRDTVGERPADVAQLVLQQGTPVAAMDLSQLSDAELAALADREAPGALEAPKPGPRLHEVAQEAGGEAATPTPATDCGR